MAGFVPVGLGCVAVCCGGVGVCTVGWSAGTPLGYRVRVDGHTEVGMQSTDRGVREGDRGSVRVGREPVSVVAT